MYLQCKRNWWLLSIIVHLISKGLLAMQFWNMSISFLQRNLAPAITSQQSCSCSSRSRHSMSCWLVKGIYFCEYIPKGGGSPGRGVQLFPRDGQHPQGHWRSIIHLTNLSNFKSRSDSETGLTSLIWSEILLLVWVHNLATFHPIIYAFLWVKSGTAKSYLWC